MRFYRLGQEQVWQWFFARITATCHDPVDLATALELTTRWLFAFVNSASVRVDEAYEVERETWLRGAAATRANAIEDILAYRKRDVLAASNVCATTWASHSVSRRHRDSAVHSGRQSRRGLRQ
jgi:hypothetical protein